MGFLETLKGGGSDAIRQSTSLTMAYLLAQNRKFERYMRQKVEELEARVAAQQARLAAREERPDAARIEQPTEPTGEPDFYEERSLLAEAAEPWSEEEPPPTETDDGASSIEPHEPPSWEVVLLGPGHESGGGEGAESGSAAPREMEEEPASLIHRPHFVGSADEVTEDNEYGVESLLPNWSSDPARSPKSTPQHTAEEEEGDWPGPLHVGPVEGWA